MQAIIVHDKVAIQTEEIDTVFKIIVFLFYQISSPSSLMLISVWQLPETVAFAGPVCAFIAVNVAAVIFFLNLLCSQISHSAKRPRNLFYRHLIKGSLSVRQRLKILQFTEHLAEQDIGYHCGHEFLMNNFKFSEFIAASVASYLMILDTMFY